MNIPKIVIPLENSIDDIKTIIESFMSSVVATLGPMGRTIIIETEDEIIPHVTKDGVTVSESIHFKDPVKQNIAALLKEASRKTSEEVGDGTTTTTLLACSFLNELIECRFDRSVNMRKVFEGIDAAVDYVVEYLQEETMEATMDSDELQAVITISSNDDKEIIDTLKDVTQKIGEHGLIDVKLADSNTTFVNISNGAMLDTNIVEFPGTSPIYEVTGACDVVLVTGAIRDIPTIEKLLTYYANHQPVIVIAKEFTDVVIRTVRTNNQRGVTNVVLAEAEGFGDSQLILLRDLATITNALIFSTDESNENALRNFNADLVGNINGMTVSQKEAILYCDPLYRESEAAQVRFKELKEQYDDHIKTDVIVSSGVHNFLKKRMSKYVSLATINVGGITKAEANERKDRYEDAVHAISSAVNNGVLPGGGSSFVRAINIIENRMDTFQTEDEKIGARIVIEVCKQPLRHLTQYSTKYDYDEIFNFIKSEPEHKLYDAVEDDLTGPYTAKLFDPALVAIKSIINASIVAKTIMGSGAIITYDYGEV